MRAVRQRAQLLAGPRPVDVAAVATRLVGVQAQASPAARLAVRARTRGLGAADVDRAGAEPAVIRTWAMRGTLHMLARTDARWIVELLGPVFARAGRRRREQLGLDERTCERALAVIDDVLRDSGPLSRAELIARITGHGVSVDATGQAPAHLVAYAAMSGVLCRGPDRERDEATYVHFDTWVGGSGPTGPDRLDSAAAARELARRYLTGYGPATAADFAAWSGLPAGVARRAFDELGADGADGAEIVEVQNARGRALTTAIEPPDALPPRLLGHFDAYLLGYRTRELILEPAHAGRIRAGGGMIAPAVLVGGRVVGTWRLDRAQARPALTVEPFAGLPRGSRDGLRAEAADIGRFLGLDLTVAIER